MKNATALSMRRARIFSFLSALLVITACESPSDPEALEDALYEGSYTATLVQTVRDTTVGPARTCSHTFALSGTVRINLFASPAPGGSIGTFVVSGSETENVV